ncbi:MAG: hypothetical protein IPN29_11355 [Saprospiraceae bacterium]|nr:hypothetical protein [Saprospiraceae bacterium]
MKSVFNKILIIVICCIFFQYGISQNVGRDSLIVRDTLSSKLIPDSTFQDSIPKTYKLSPDAITSVIKYGAVDSNRTDIIHKEVHLYGSAYTDYETIKLRADYIVFNFNTSVVSAYRSRDSVYVPKELPSFVDGQTQAGFSSMQYNFKTKKALVQTLSTKESEFYLIGEKSKYIGKENDSIYHEDRFFNQNAIITTCNHPSPHFGIRTRKMKFIPDQIAVMGPSQLEIAGIPTPLILPFGFFPLIKGQSSGLIFPSDFPYDNNFGFGIRGVGYYFPINDYVDARITGDIWTRGSHAVRVQTNYKRRYKYTGNIELNYSNNILEDAKGVSNPQKSFGLRIAHNQDAKAHPYRSIGGSVNIETNRNRQRTNYDYQSITNNKLYSNFNFIYRWPESPFSLRAAFSHNQDNRTRIVNITLPDASLNMNTIQPFKRKNASGDPLWYENVSVSYRAGLKNFVKTTDTTLFTRATLENIETGLSHGTSISSNARVLKYFNLSPSMNYDEAYFLKTLEKSFDPTPVLDTIVTGIDAEGNPQTDIRVSKYGSVNQKLSRGLEVFRKFNTSISMNTQLFAIKQWKSGWLRGMRHIMKPSVSFNYARIRIKNTGNMWIPIPDLIKIPESTTTHFKPVLFLSHSMKSKCPSAIILSMYLKQNTEVAKIPWIKS